MIRRILTHWVVAALLSDVRAYRRYYGGHWERWHLSDGGSVWLLNPYHGERPARCFGTPTCETW